MHQTTLIAENHIRISHTLFNEGMRAAGNKTYQKTVQKLALVLLALYLAVAVWLLYTGSSLLLLIGESIFLGAVLFWLIIMLPHTKWRSKYKAMSHGADDIPERTVKFYPNHLTVIAHTGKETSLQYNDMRDWLETKNLYILNFNHNISVLLDKNGFVTGDFHEVQPLFICSK